MTTNMARVNCDTNMLGYRLTIQKEVVDYTQRHTQTTFTGIFKCRVFLAKAWTYILFYP